ncbi:MAG: hypothetical protein J1E84_01500 [Muribaculaceae bacterium]|nr:hypothetical protein [Muribaculaceae bacterium]
MTRYSSIYILLLVLFVSLIGCNEDDPNNGESSYKSVAIKSFNLQKDDSVLVNLDSVFFSIDLVEHRIFNADSLPKGTQIDKLMVKVGADLTRNVEIIQPRGNGLSDTIINLISTPNDSIDFSHGPVTLRITSYDGAFTANYEVKVNVHQSEPDTLCWSRVAHRDVPTTLSEIVASRIVRIGDTALVMATDGKSTTVATTTNPDVDNWEIKSVDMPAGVDVATLTASDDALYILASGTLYVSTDLGETWSSTDVAMTWIYGISGGEIVGCNSDTRKTVCYPSGVSVDIPSGMPVSKTSTMESFGSKWSESQFSIFIGGVLADGTRTAASWGWDGSKWACINENTHIAPAEGITLLRYRYYVVNHNTWRVTEQEALYAIGGKTANGYSKDVYISTNQGYSWNLAGSMLQLPDFMPAISGASAVVFSTKMRLDDVRSTGSGLWNEMPMRLPAWYSLDLWPDTRVGAPVTEWDCPYIYLTGGNTDGDRAMTMMWRGVINRLRFNPRY